MNEKQIENIPADSLNGLESNGEKKKYFDIKSVPFSFPTHIYAIY